MGISDKYASADTGERKSRRTDGPFAAANALDTSAVLDWLGIEHEGKRIKSCWACGASSGCDIVDGGVKCQHDTCETKGKDGFRTNVDLVIEVRGVSNIQAVNLLSKQFGTPRIEGRGPSKRAEPIRPTGESWEDQLVTGKAGDPLVGLGNVILILSNHPAFAGTVAHNEFTHFSEVIKPLQWDDAESFEPREWSDNDDIRTAAWIQLEYRFAPSTDMVAKAITSIANEAHYHPVRDYLDKCAESWDGTKRIDSLFLDYFAARTGDDKTNLYLASAGRRFLIGSVARIYDPGCKLDTMPIVCGDQGVFKSTGFRRLFEPWFTDQLSTPGNKDADEQLRGIWCVEFAELEQLDKAEITRIKGFLSRQDDRFRWSYARRVEVYPRQNAFVGTTNIENWNRDETGARRMWPVSVRGEVDLAGLKRDRDQLWAEAVLAYRDGEQWHLTREEEALAKDEQEDRRQTDALEEPMDRYLTGRNYASIADILTNVLRLDESKWNQSIQNQVAKIFRAWGWTLHRDRVPGGRQNRYHRPDPTPVRVADPDQKADPDRTLTTKTTEKTSLGHTGQGGQGMYEFLPEEKGSSRSDNSTQTAHAYPFSPSPYQNHVDNPDRDQPLTTHDESPEAYLARVLPLSDEERVSC